MDKRLNIHFTNLLQLYLKIYIFGATFSKGCYQALPKALPPNTELAAIGS